LSCNETSSAKIYLEAVSACDTGRRVLDSFSASSIVVLVINIVIVIDQHMECDERDAVSVFNILFFE